MRFVASKELKCHKYSLALDDVIRIDIFDGKKIFFGRLVLNLVEQRDIIT
jgi:hypothetical protein